jgi:hypothetical protein
MHRPLPLAVVVVLGLAAGVRSQETSEQDRVLLRIGTDHSTVYPMQRFTVTLAVAIRELPEPYQDQDPIEALTQLQRKPPQLRIPWIDSRQIPDGLTPDSPWEDWLEPIRGKGKPGFRINDVGEHSVQTLFENRTVTFRPAPRRIVHPDQNGIEKRYWQYEFARQFLACKVGRYQFGPVVLEGDIALSLDEEKSLVPETISVRAEPVSVDVQAIPEEGRPAQYVGIVGRFDLDATLTPRQAKVGDPMVLEIRLRGEGSLDAATPPDLQSMADLQGRFRVYEASQETGPDELRFLYRLRPLQAGIETFPAIPLAYFDVAQEKYVTLRTSPIPLQVLSADRLGSDQVVTASAPPKSAATAPQGIREGMYANIVDPEAVHDDSLRPGHCIAAMGGIAALYLAAALTVRVRRRAQQTAGTRRHAAPRRAKRRLRQARAELAAGRTLGAAEMIHATVAGLVADTAGVPPATLTRRDIRSRLVEQGVEPGLIVEVLQVLEACDVARFGDAPDGLAASAPALDRTIQRLISSFEKQG